jgi:hypothetical protein
MSDDFDDEPIDDGWEDDDTNTQKEFIEMAEIIKRWILR